MISFHMGDAGFSVVFFLFDLWSNVDLHPYGADQVFFKYVHTGVMTGIMSGLLSIIL